MSDEYLKRKGAHHPRAYFIAVLRNATGAEIAGYGGFVPDPSKAKAKPKAKRSAPDSKTPKEKPPKRTGDPNTQPEWQNYVRCLDERCCENVCQRAERALRAVLAAKPFIWAQSNIDGHIRRLQDEHGYGLTSDAAAMSITTNPVHTPNQNPTQSQSAMDESAMSPTIAPLTACAHEYSNFRRPDGTRLCRYCGDPEVRVKGDAQAAPQPAPGALSRPIVPSLRPWDPSDPQPSEAERDWLALRIKYSAYFRPQRPCSPKTREKALAAVRKHQQKYPDVRVVYIELTAPQPPPHRTDPALLIQ
jgi:hypothetical protein